MMSQTLARRDIEDLRREVGALVAGTREALPRLPLGVSAIDEALGGGLVRHGLHEARGGAAAAFALGLARMLGGAAAWVRSPDAATALQPEAFQAVDIKPESMLIVHARKQEALWAFEQALASGALPLAILDASAAPDFAETRRLSLKAREAGVLGLILAADAPRLAMPASAAETRWLIEPSPSARPFTAPAYRLALLKNKNGPNAAWEAEWDGSAHRFRLAAATADRSRLAPPARMAA